VITAADTQVMVTGIGASPGAGPGVNLTGEQLVWSQEGVLTQVYSIGQQGMPVLEGISPTGSLSDMSMPVHLLMRSLGS